MKTLLALLFSALALTPSATARSRTWVSSTGLDTNPCSRTAPCGTFAGALAKTDSAGEINCADSGEFGNGATLTIAQSVIIDCRGAFGSISLANPFFVDIYINAAASDLVTIRNVSVNGSTGFCIAITSAHALHLENIRASSCGILVEAAATTLVTVDNATISDCGEGIAAYSLAGTAIVSINNTRIANVSTGVEASSGSRVTIRNSTIYYDGFGIEQNFGQDLTGGSVVTVISSTLGYIWGAALRSHTGEFLFAFGNTFINDELVYNPNGGTIFTGADNNNSGSTPGTANGGSVPKI